MPAALRAEHAALAAGVLSASAIHPQLFEHGRESGQLLWGRAKVRRQNILLVHIESVDVEAAYVVGNLGLVLQERSNGAHRSAVDLDFARHELARTQHDCKRMRVEARLCVQVALFVQPFLELAACP